jgi:hypothetical protein
LRINEDSFRERNFKTAQNNQPELILTGDYFGEVFFITVDRLWNKDTGLYDKRIYKLSVSNQRELQLSLHEKTTVKKALGFFWSDIDYTKPPLTSEFAVLKPFSGEIL